MWAESFEEWLKRVKLCDYIEEQRELYKRKKRSSIYGKHINPLMQEVVVPLYKQHCYECQLEAGEYVDEA